jgi:DNA-binding NarL/FixJ family response regulator
MPLRVLIADDHEAVRQGLRWMFRSDPDIAIVGEAVDGHDLLALIDRVPCDAVLLDLAMPRMDGLEVLRRLRATGRDIPIVVLSMHDDAAHVDRALALGASGYILKSASLEEMTRALSAAATGGAYVQPSLAKPMLALNIVAGVEPDLEQPVGMTPRQIQLLRGLASGRSNKELAADLGITEATVKGYLKELYARLGVGSRAGAVSYGLRHRIIR